MSENNNNNAPILVAANTATDQVTALDISRRHQRENEIAAVEVLSHRRRKKLEELIKGRSEVLTKLHKRAEDFNTEIGKNIKSHALVLDLSKLDAAAVALNAIGIGNFAAGVTGLERNDKDEIVTYNTNLVRLGDNTKQEELDQIAETREIETGYRYHSSSSSSHEVVGDKIKVEVPFAEINGLVGNRDSLKETNEQIKTVQDELDQLNGELVTLPQFQQELKVHLAERQLGDTEEGQKILEAIDSKAFAGFENLLALPEGKS